MRKSEKNLEFEDLLLDLGSRRDEVIQGGGPTRIAKHHQKGKLTARERISYLIDDEDDAMEIGTFAADGMYQDEGGCPSAGVVVVVAKVSGRQAVIVANDATVKAGAWFPMTAKKNLRAQEIAIENRIPIIYLVDSAGVYLPMQDEIFPDKEHFGRQFRNNAHMSSMGIVQVAAIMGSCVAGGAYLPIMSDEAMIVEGTGSIFLAGSYLVKAAIGEDIDNETLGGAATHCEISGVTDKKFETDQECLDAVKRIFDQMGDAPTAGFNHKKGVAPKAASSEITSSFPLNRNVSYDVRKVLDHIIDKDSLDEYKPDYGKTLMCGYARISGWSVGIVANQRQVVKDGKGEMQMGGVIYSDSADKAARFIMNCNQRKIPLVFFHDVNGFMVGSRAEHGGIIKDGAKMVNAVSNSVVPKFTVVMGSSYGAGNYAMCGKAYDPRFIFAWPSAQIAVMSGNSAAKTLLQIKVSSLKAKGQEITPEQEEKLLSDIRNTYNEKLSPYYAAANLWVDDVISPADTRDKLAHALEVSNHAPLTQRMNVGVIQT